MILASLVEMGLCSTSMAKATRFSASFQISRSKSTLGYWPPMGRTRDNTWIQALGILFNSHSFSLEATKAASWDAKVDHLSFTYDGSEIATTKGPLSSWSAPGRDIMVERISNKNSVVVNLKGMAEIMVNVVPITEEDDRIHKYMLPSDDCFAHLEVQFKFFGLSPEVEGVLGRTFQPDFVNPAKPGVAMPVVGGEDKYRTTSLLSADCKFCIFSPGSALNQDNHSLMTNTLIMAHWIAPVVPPLVPAMALFARNKCQAAEACYSSST